MQSDEALALAMQVRSSWLLQETMQETPIPGRGVWG